MNSRVILRLVIGILLISLVPYCSSADKADDKDEPPEAEDSDGETVHEATVESNEPKKKNPAVQKKFSNIFTSKEETRKSPKPEDKHTIAEINAISKLCGKKALFLDLKPSHMKAQYKLMALLRGKTKTDDLLEFAKRLQHHPKLNHKLWLKAFVSVSVERPDLLGMDMPHLLKQIPESFVHSQQLRDVQQGQMNGECVHLDGRYTAASSAHNDEIEQKLAYLREDMFVNIRHWNWHNEFQLNYTGKEIDRRGEHFYYFHHNIISRYHAARLAEGLSRVKPFDLKEGGFLEEGYNPCLGDIDAEDNIYGERYALRHAHLKLKNVSYLVEIAKRIGDDIKAHEFQKSDGEKVSTRNASFMTEFGNLFEGDGSHSINEERYSGFGFHNHGHFIIANMSTNGTGVMAASETAQRDPIFYRWHTLIDTIMSRVKAELPPYQANKGELPLFWKVAHIRDFKVKSETVAGGKKLNPYELETFFQNVTITLEQSATINPEEDSTKYCIRTLNHRPFSYEFMIISSAEGSTRATIRIFMAPRLDEDGKRFGFEEQRKLFFPMDEIVVYLLKGHNRFHRHSRDSKLTLLSKFDGKEQGHTRQCECGYPSHHLLPKGREKGMVYDLFAMVTDGVVDKVKDDKALGNPPCYPAHIVCGRPGEKYPDSRPMGYPFDRKPFNVKNQSGKERPVAVLDEYVTNMPNMKTVQVKIFHSSKTASTKSGKANKPSKIKPSEEKSSKEKSSEDEPAGD